MSTCSTTLLLACTPQRATPRGYRTVIHADGQDGVCLQTSTSRALSNRVTKLPARFYTKLDVLYKIAAGMTVATCTVSTVMADVRQTSTSCALSNRVAKPPTSLYTQLAVLYNIAAGGLASTCTVTWLPHSNTCWLPTSHNSTNIDAQRP